MKLVVPVFAAFFSAPVAWAQTSQSSVRVVVDTTSLPRAAGLAMKIEFPQGWTVVDGKNPTIAISASAPATAGTSSCNLQILNMATIMGRPDYEVSKEDLRGLLSTSFAKKETAQVGITYVDSGPLTVGGIPAFWTLGTNSIKLPRTSIGQAMYITKTFYRRWQVSLYCAETADTEDDALLTVTRNQATFRQIANSMSFLNKQ